MKQKLKQTRTEVLSAYLETQVTDPIRSDLLKLINKIDQKIDKELEATECTPEPETVEELTKILHRHRCGYFAACESMHEAARKGFTARAEFFRAKSEADYEAFQSTLKKIKKAA
jgi:hypothetical protein